MINFYCRSAAVLAVLLALGSGVCAEQHVALSKLEVQHATTGWSEVGVDQSVSGQPLRIGGRTFVHGLGVHAVSTIHLDLGGTASRFSAMVGVDDVMRGKGRVEFVVRGDGRVLWRSGAMRGGQVAKEIDVALKGVQLLALDVSDGGDGIGQDHANWADASIVFTGERPRIVPIERHFSPTNRDEARVALIPYPRQAVWHEGRLDMSRFRVKTPKDDAPEFDSVVRTLFQVLEDAGCVLSADDGVMVELSLDDGVEGDESYVLHVGGDGIVIRASSFSGLYYGVQTLRQLLASGTSAPMCEIQDRPAFAWRGFMHDLGRNPQDVDLLKRFIDTMAQYKLNVFHMHLTDYPGYRIECKKYPELNKADNQRQTRRPGFFYTYKQLNDLIAYCAERHIMVVPEIDMPGHSDYFKTAFGVDMQDPKGMVILSDVVNEFLDHVDLPYFHMGSDEVHVRNKAFMPHMERLIRDRGKDILVWRPGFLPNHKAITQIWSGKPRPVKGVRYIDSQANYVNHMDPFTGPIRAFMQQPCRVQEGSDLALGGILCHWPDNNVGDQLNIYRQSPVMPALVAYAERIWRGAQNNRDDAWAKLPPAGDSAFKDFQAFEADLLQHRDRYFTEWPFPYVKQTEMTWQLIGPFDHKGDTAASFPVEQAIKPSYDVDGKTLAWRPAEVRGGTIHVNHFFGFPGHLPKSNPGTVYALTTINSPIDQDVDFWIGFNEHSRSGGRRAGPNPEQGQWSVVHSKVWINDEAVAPPKWQQPGLTEKTAEIPFVDELYMSRKPVKVHLRKGANKLLVKVPHGKPAWKWSFTCVPVAWDGERVREVEGLRFTTKIKTGKEPNQLVKEASK